MLKRKAITLAPSPSPLREAKRADLKSVRKSFHESSKDQVGFEEETLVFVVENTQSGSLKKLFHAQCLTTTEDPVKFSDCQPAPNYTTCNGGLDLHNAYYVSKDKQSLILCVVVDLEYHFSAKNICGCLSEAPMKDGKRVETCYFWILSISQERCPRDVFQKLQTKINGGNVIQRAYAGIFNFLATSITGIGMKVAALGSIGYAKHLYQKRLDRLLLHWLGQLDYLKSGNELHDNISIANVSSVLFLSCSIIFLGAKFILSCFREIMGSKKNRFVPIVTLCVGVFIIFGSLYECWDMLSSILKAPAPEFIMQLMEEASRRSQTIINPCLNTVSCISIMRPLLEHLKVAATSGIREVRREVSENVAKARRRISTGGDRIRKGVQRTVSTGRESLRKAAKKISSYARPKKAENATADTIDLEAQRTVNEEPEQPSAASSSVQKLDILKTSTTSFVKETLRNMGVPAEESNKVPCFIQSMSSKIEPLFQKQDHRRGKGELFDSILQVGIHAVALSTLLACGPGASLKEQTDMLLLNPEFQKLPSLKLSIDPARPIRNQEVEVIPQFASNIIFSHRAFSVSAVIDMLTYFLKTNLTEDEREGLRQDMFFLSQRGCPADWVGNLAPDKPS